MSFSAAAWALAASGKLLTVLRPSVPILPHWVFRTLPSTHTSQNLFDVPSENSNRRLLGAAAGAAGGAAAAAGAGAAGAGGAGAAAAGTAGAGAAATVF